MNNLKRPSLVVFDLDDTLYNYKEPNRIATKILITRISLHAGIREKEIAEVYSAARINVKSQLGNVGSSHSRLLYIAETFRLLKLRPNARIFLELEEIFWGSFMEQMELNPGALDLIHALKYQDISIALVTDLTSQIQYKKLENLGLSNLFDLIVTSEEAGGDKVTKKPFNFLSQKLDEIPSCVWFIGDGDYDVDRQLLADGYFFRPNTNQNKSQNRNEIGYENFIEIMNYLV